MKEKKVILSVEQLRNLRSKLLAGDVNVAIGYLDFWIEKAEK